MPCLISSALTFGDTPPAAPRTQLPEGKAQMKKDLAAGTPDIFTRRLRTTAAAFVALLLAATTLPTPARAAGEFDSSFGAGGFVTTDLGGYETGDYAAVQADGRIVVVGSAEKEIGQPPRADISLLRYRADGALDPTFGDGGKVLLDFGNTLDLPTGVCLQADGKIVVVGTSYAISTDTTDFVLARLNPDGTPDASYGAGGTVRMNFDKPSPAYPFTALIQPDGRVVVAGFVNTGNDPLLFSADFFATRFNTDGTLDTTFGTQGRASVDIGEYDLAVGAALQADGRIVLVGYTGVNADPHPTSFAVARLKADGTPDPTFDGDGRLTTTFFGHDSASSVMVQADGKLVVAGEAARGGLAAEPDFALARYETNGALDPTFGAGGRVTLDFDYGLDTAIGVAAAPGGRLIAGGYTYTRGPGGLGPLFAAARFNADGSPDNTFGGGGRLTTHFPGGRRALARGMTTQADGKPVLVGEVEVLPPPQSDNFSDVGLARFDLSASPATPSFAHFSAQSYGGGEGCAAPLVTVTREGDLSAPALVEYKTLAGTASQASDYTQVSGTLLFAAGESSKSFGVPVNEDAFAEGAETIRVELVSASANVNFRVPAAATLTVNDDDATDGSTNPLDSSQGFVCQHYHDFLSRQPDDSGLQFWTQGIESCGSDAQCREVKRIDVSTAFFLSIEFQQTGYFVIRAHKAAFGDNKWTPRYFDFLRDTQRVGQGVVVGTPGADAQLEANKQAFAVALVTRPEFLAQFPESMTFDEYVGKLFANAGVTPTPAEINVAFESYSNTVQGRANALRAVVESNSVYNRLFNAGFVLSQYFGYLRRDPNGAPDQDFQGYDFWLSKLDSFSLPGEDVRDERVALVRIRRAEMVKAFVTSLEYRQRFGPP
jgi:uncharacterized delta-60 repeat protein